jgi:hypothetical protein
MGFLIFWESVVKGTVQKLFLGSQKLGWRGAGKAE